MGILLTGGYPMEKKCCCNTMESTGHHARDEKVVKDLTTRLNKIEGQVRGLKKMVENGAYCPDIIIQVSAVTSALNSFSKLLLEAHIKGCVTEDILKGKTETVDELVDVLQKVMK